jgi:hypothetical protein
VSSRPAFALVCCILACGNDTADPDAGRVDVGRPDAGARDAGARDAARRDGGRDAGPPVDAASLDPEWVRLTEVPDPEACQIDVARHPDHVRPLPRFEPCGSGCRQLVADWEPSERGGRLFPGAGHHDGLHAYFVYGRPYQPETGVEGGYLLVARDDGRHLLAIRYVARTGCTLAGLGITATTFATAVIISDGVLRESWPIRARYDDPVEEWATPAEPRARILDHVVLTYTSDTTTVYQGGTSARFYRYGPTGEIDELGAGRELTSTAVSGDQVFVSAFESTGWQIDTVAPGGSAHEPFVSPRDGDAWLEATDGIDFIWEQTYGDISLPDYERVEMWTSPYATTASGLRPRLLFAHPVPVISKHGVGFGRLWTTQLVTHEGPLRVLIQTLDGTDRRAWTLPADRGFYSDALLGPEEVGLWIHYIGPYLGAEALRFYRYDALPPPEEGS